MKGEAKGADRAHDGFLVGSVHLLLLCNLFIAQPTYDVLRRSPEFFFAHDVALMDVLVLVLVLSLLISLPLIVATGVAGLFAEAARRWVQTLLLFLLTTCGLQLALRSSATFETLAIPVAIAGALIFCVMYRRYFAVRLSMTMASPAVLVIATLFVWNLASTGILSSVAEVQRSVRIDGASPKSVVMIVFDQLSTSSLLGSNGAVDRTRLPAFARLADDSIWFRNATTVAESTVTSVPAILTGRFPVEANPFPPPSSVGYPENLIGFIASSHMANVSEEITRFSPRSMREPPPDFIQRSTRLLRDVGIVSAHVLLPEHWRFGIPTIEGEVAFFGLREGDALDHANAMSEGARIAQVSRFLDRMQEVTQSADGLAPTFHFLHIVLPHTPYNFRPDRSQYTRRWWVPGLRSSWGYWYRGEEPARQGLQRYLLQLLLVDTLLGEILDRMQALGLYDDALLLVTADHGSSFTPKAHSRAITPETRTDVLYVPLFLKLPGERRGINDDRNAQTVDILPTIADFIDVPLPWSVDGRSLLAAPQTMPKEKHAFITVGYRGLKAFDATDGGEFHSLVPMMERLVYEPERRWLRLASSRDDLLGQSLKEIEGQLESSGKLPLILFGADEATDDSDAVFELRSGWIQGQIEAPPGQLHHQWDVVIAVEGKVRAVTRSFRIRRTKHYFAALLATEDIPKGSGEVEVRILKDERE